MNDKKLNLFVRLNIIVYIGIAAIFGMAAVAKWLEKRIDENSENFRKNVEGRFSANNWQKYTSMSEERRDKAESTPLKKEESYTEATVKPKKSYTEATVKPKKSDRPDNRTEIKTPDIADGKQVVKFWFELINHFAAQIITQSQEKMSKNAPRDLKEFLSVVEKTADEVVDDSPYREIVTNISKRGEIKAFKDAAQAWKRIKNASASIAYWKIARYYDNGKYANSLFKVMVENNVVVVVDPSIYILDYDPKLDLDPKCVLTVINLFYADKELSIDEMERLYIPLNDISGKLIAGNDIIIFSKYTDLIESLATRSVSLGMADTNNAQRWTAIAGKFADLYQRSKAKMHYKLLDNIHRAAEQVKEINRQK